MFVVFVMIDDELLLTLEPRAFRFVDGVSKLEASIAPLYGVVIVEFKILCRPCTSETFNVALTILLLNRFSGLMRVPNYCTVEPPRIDRF